MLISNYIVLKKEYFHINVMSLGTYTHHLKAHTFFKNYTISDMFQNFESVVLVWYISMNLTIYTST